MATPRANTGTSAELLRSLLFVPGDDERKLAKAESVPADALILDLEDSVVPERKAHARALAAEFLHARRVASQSLWVRVNSLDTPECHADIASIVATRPDGLVLPKVRSAADIAELGLMLDELERRTGGAGRPIKIMPIATETAAGTLALASYANAGPRLGALTWGAEDLAVALGAATNVDDRGEWLPPYELARSLCLLAAAAAGVPAIDTVYTSFRDAAGLERQAARAKRDGFAGQLAVHPDQVEILNRTFRPTADEVAEAKRVVAAFTRGQAGAVALDGRMLDRPHLARAERVLGMAAALGGTGGA